MDPSQGLHMQPPPVQALRDFRSSGNSRPDHATPLTKPQGDKGPSRPAEIMVMLWWLTGCYILAGHSASWSGFTALRPSGPCRLSTSGTSRPS